MSTPSTTGTVPWIRITDAPGHVGSQVELRGWVEHKRSSGKVQFLLIRDGSGVMQCVAGVRDLSPEEWEACARLTHESSCVVRGALRADPRSRGGVELGLSSVRPVSIAQA